MNYSIDKSIDKVLIKNLLVLYLPVLLHVWTSRTYTFFYHNKRYMIFSGTLKEKNKCPELY